jgi:hypothetical protein
MVADALRSPSCPLQSLFLAGSSIGDRGAVALANALEVNSRLTELILSSNVIGVNGALAFTNVLRRSNRTLISLPLNGNPVGEVGGRAILEMFTDTNAKYVDLSINVTDTPRELFFRIEEAKRNKKAGKVVAPPAMVLTAPQIQGGATAIARPIPPQLAPRRGFPQ